MESSERRSLTSLGLRLDLRAQPESYPGPPPPGPGVLHGQTYTIGDLGETGHLHAVLAVGSNASPDVVRAKMQRAGVHSRVPMRPIVVSRLAVGISAHVARAGYVPAAPIRGGGTRTFWMTYLDDAQLAAMDETEPNYQRCQLPADCSCDEAGVWVYRSRRGVVPDGAGHPAFFDVRQAVVRARLSAFLDAAGEAGGICDGLGPGLEPA